MGTSRFFLSWGICPQGVIVTPSNGGTLQNEVLWNLMKWRGFSSAIFARARVLMCGRGVRHARLEARGKSGMEKC